MSPPRLSQLIALTAATLLTVAPRPVAACWLTDMLHGRQPTPYAVGFAPPPAAVVPSGVVGMPTSHQPYTSGYAPLLTTPTLATPALATPTLASNGVFQSQRPAFGVGSPGIDNPSVYTGLPLAGNRRTSFQVPISATPGSTAIALPTGLPPSQFPAANVASPFTTPQPTAGGGLSRFFGSLFGTNYQTQVNRVPVTYYRSTPTIDPRLGTAVVTQRPCTGFENQVQQTPFATLQPGYQQPSSPTYAPGPTCAAPLPNGIGQVGAVGIGPGSTAAPIPSTTDPGAFPPAGNFGPPPNGLTPLSPYANTAPLTGAPSPPGQTPATQSPSAYGQSDRNPVDRPTLNRPRFETEFHEPDRSNLLDTPEPPRRNERSDDAGRTDDDSQKSFFELQDAEDSTAMIRPPRRFDSELTDTAARGGVEPIRGLDDYPRSPFAAGNDSRYDSQPTPYRTLPAPPLPARRTRPVDDFDRDVTSAGLNSRQPPNRDRRSPVREAGMVRRTSYDALPPLPRPDRVSSNPGRTEPQPKRENRWVTVP